ncbi:MAG: Gfo/Idh/MocA family oxidoreductase [Planctomycetes bacterium]|nr:Gfo/Idh/MocA family oxidoreductase [Planctomycetota bacterium]
MLGSKFMGRAHSNAWMSVNKFFDLPCGAVMHSVCGRDEMATSAFGERWGWASALTDWERAVADPDVDLVDVCTPNDVHAGPAIAALEAGKHVACEKPLAGTLDDARAMRDAAELAKADGLRTFVWFNYRRCPAIAYAHRLIRGGGLGRIFHVRAQYLQDWGGPETPLVWRFDAGQAGSGAHGDLNAHLIDLTRFLTGEEITQVSGAVEETFVTERKLPGGGTGKSTVDDCVLFLARFAGGAVGSFEATRLATGNKNRNTIEINGERGAIRFDFERMNELLWWDDTLPSAQRGWSRVMCTNAGDHPYVEAYWPPGHGLGYEHGFVSQAADILASVGGAEPVVPIPDFADAWETQRVLAAAIVSAREGRAVPLDEIG